MVALENDLYPITVWENMENHLQNVRPFRSINGRCLDCACFHVLSFPHPKALRLFFVQQSSQFLNMSGNQPQTMFPLSIRWKSRRLVAHKTEWPNIYQTNMKTSCWKLKVVGISH